MALTIHRDLPERWTVRDEHRLVLHAGDYAACLHYVVHRLASGREGECSNV